MQLPLVILGFSLGVLQPRLDRPVLLVEVVHVRHQVLHHIHVGQGVDLDSLGLIDSTVNGRGLVEDVGVEIIDVMKLGKLNS